MARATDPQQFVGDTNPAGAADGAEGCAAIHGDLDRLEKWSNTKFMKTSNCWKTTWQRSCSWGKAVFPWISLESWENQFTPAVVTTSLLGCIRQSCWHICQQVEEMTLPLAKPW